MARSKVTVAGEPSQEAQLQALATAARISMAQRIRGEALTLEEAEQLAAIFPPWRPGLEVSAGEVYSHRGGIVECIQGHTTQADWAPGSPDTAALWKPYRDPAAGPTPWEQPAGAHDAYPLDAVVTHDGKTWRSLHRANVWEPPQQWTEVV